MLKTECRFFTIADYEDEEIWLREQHRRGLRLVKFRLPCFYAFEECAPEDVIYRLDYKNACADSDYLQLFRDYGWEYFLSAVGWLYFRKPAAEVQSEAEGQIFSDGASRVEMIRHIYKTRMLPLFIILLTIILPNLISSFTGVFGSAGRFFTGLYAVMLFLYLCLLTHCSSKLSRLRRRYADRV